jgi:hypothetical protein
MSPHRYVVDRFDVVDHFSLGQGHHLNVATPQTIEHDTPLADHRHGTTAAPSLLLRPSVNHLQEGKVGSLHREVQKVHHAHERVRCVSLARARDYPRRRRRQAEHRIGEFAQHRVAGRKTGR